MPETYLPKRVPRLRFVPIRGVDYAVTEWGNPENPGLVFLHGFGDCGATFQFVVDALHRDWHVIAPDWRGFGKTEVHAESFWFPDYLADLDRLLAHYSDAEPAVLIGHSMGGNVAGLYAGAMPGRVRAIVNLEGFGLHDAAPDEAPDRYRDWLLGSAAPPAATRRADFGTLAAAIRRRIPQMSMAQADFVARCWATPSTGGGVQLRVHPAHKLPNPVLYRRAEAEACWRRISAPVLLIAGRNSNFPPPDDLPFSDARTAWIENSGHMLHFEQPAAVAQAIEDFLAGE